MLVAVAASTLLMTLPARTLSPSLAAVMQCEQVGGIYAHILFHVFQNRSGFTQMSLFPSVSLTSGGASSRPSQPAHRASSCPQSKVLQVTSAHHFTAFLFSVDMYLVSKTKLAIVRENTL